ncbi:hypothetical protein SAMN05216389_1266 [Oceanobacillus limi]|uniref:Uncharacterized protein n=1 Tax=Oceanobacillus limi TaxID=930131 RepID=A0A1I0GYT6_9BACI|nr:hypothetical protein [Oceanobacillus limi]SET76444.1 hypothetical protein SAMN05216389_1266 [Oceanobacillus limi]
MKIEKNVLKQHFDSEQTNPRFIAYLKHRGLTVGDQYKVHEFMKWIRSKLEDFKKENKISKYHPLSNEQQLEFTRYISGEDKQLELLDLT